MKPTIARLSDFIRSFRFSRSYVLITTMLMGAFTAGYRPRARDYLVLTLIAIAGHLFGFAMNDLADYRFDRFNPKHLSRPSLVSRGYNKGLYMTVMFIQLPIIFSLLFLNYSAWDSLPWFLAAILLVTAYNLLAKRSGVYIWAVHLLFPMSLLVLCIGCHALFAPVLEAEPAFLIFLLIFFMNVYMINGLIASVMDLKSDFQAGAGSVSLVLGCYIEGDRVILSRKIRLITITLYFLSAALIPVTALLNRVPWPVYPVSMIFFLYGYAHLKAYLRIDDPVMLQKFYAGTSGLYLFFANTLAWIHIIPSVWWVIIALALIKPLTERRPGRFGVPTLRALFMGN